MAKYTIDARFILGLAMILLSYLGNKIPDADALLIEPATVICQNARLFNESFKSDSCPLDPDSDTRSLYMNEQNYGSDREVVVSLVAKRHNMPTYMTGTKMRINIDAALVSIDKKSNKVMHREFSNLIDENNGIFVNNISVRLPLVVTKMDPDHYYEFEVYEVRAYNEREGFLYNVDHYTTKRIMVNVMIGTTEVISFSRLRTYQTNCLYALCILTALFISYLVSSYPRKLICPYVWLAILYTGVACVYLLPFDIPHASITARYAIYVGAVATMADFLIVFRCLHSVISGLSTFILFWINVFIGAFIMLGSRDTKDKHFPVVIEFRLRNAEMYQENVRMLLGIKFWVYVICAIIGYLRYQSVGYRVRQLLPLMITVAYWITSFEGMMLPFLEDEKNPHKVYLEYAFVPLVSLILQYVALLPDKPYLLMPPIDELSVENDKNKDK